MLYYTRRYVLKPQREGGGNNIYGSDIVDALKVERNLISPKNQGVSIKNFLNFNSRTWLHWSVAVTF